MKAAFHTLGCKVNQYETEAIREQFVQAGYEIVSEDDYADVYIINTCTVTNMADRKSRQFIRRARKNNPDAVVAVTGCYAQMNGEEVASIDGVAIVTGTDEKHSILEQVTEYLQENNLGNQDGARVTIKEYDELKEYEDLGVIRDMEGRSRAFVKIQEGCNRFCSYCIIPYARGNVRSRSEDEILQEVQGFLQKGYKEIVLTGINTALYGTESGEGIAPLIARLNALPGEFRIRLSSLEPTVVNAAYAKSLLQYEKLCHHLHLSIQSGSNSVLGRMNRHYTREEYLDIVEAVRAVDSEYGISTDIIVGFPGETEEEFGDSVKITEDVDFCRVHPFRYSPRKGTPAAERTDQVEGETKNTRAQRLAEAAERSQNRFLQKNAGKVRPVLIEEQIDAYMVGYTDNYIKVYLSGEQELFNHIVDVKLLEPYQDGMLGERVPAGKE